MRVPTISSTFLVCHAFLVFPKSTNEADLPLTAPEPGTPVVTGLRITGPMSPEAVEIWGNPSDPMVWNSGRHLDFLRIICNFY